MTFVVCLACWCVVTRWAWLELDHWEQWRTEAALADPVIEQERDQSASTEASVSPQRSWASS